MPKRESKGECSGCEFAGATTKPGFVRCKLLRKVMRVSSIEPSDNAECAYRHWFEEILAETQRELIAEARNLRVATREIPSELRQIHMGFDLPKECRPLMAAI